MVASILETGHVQVECVCTHYSHQIELQHVWVPKSHKRDTPKRSPTQTYQQIVNDIQRNAGDVFSTHHVLSRPEIPDIVDMFVPSTIQRSSDDQSSLLSWIKQWDMESESSPIVAYRIQGNTCGYDMSELMEDDFIVIIQTELQKEMMQKFGKTCICCDSMMVGTKFALTTLLVCDEFFECHPVAWCLSRANTEPFMNIFFGSVRNCCGEINPIWFMSPQLDHFHHAWMAVFGSTSRRLICPWFVHQAWAESLKKLVGNISIESTMNKLLKVLLEQTDHKLFEDHLQTLLERLCGSAKTQEFRRYVESRTNVYTNPASIYMYCV